MVLLEILLSILLLVRGLAVPAERRAHTRDNKEKTCKLYWVIH